MQRGGRVASGVQRCVCVCVFVSVSLKCASVCLRSAGSSRATRTERAASTSPMTAPSCGRGGWTTRSAAGTSGRDGSCSSTTSPRRYTHTHTHTHTRTHTHTHTHTHTCTHTHITWSHTHKHTETSVRVARKRQATTYVLGKCRKPAFSLVSCSGASFLEV